MDPKAKSIFTKIISFCALFRQNLQDALRSSQEEPKTPQKAPQEAPKTPPRPPKRLPRRPQDLPRGSQDTPKTPQEADLEDWLGIFIRRIDMALVDKPGTS